jgi:hypothetical protein
MCQWDESSNLHLTPKQMLDEFCRRDPPKSNISEGTSGLVRGPKVWSVELATDNRLQSASEAHPLRFARSASGMVGPNGASPLCDLYEERLAFVLSMINQVNSIQQNQAALASVHKSLRLCDLCKELALGTKPAKR